MPPTHNNDNPHTEIGINYTELKNIIIFKNGMGQVTIINKVEKDSLESCILITYLYRNSSAVTYSFLEKFKYLTDYMTCYVYDSVKSYIKSFECDNEVYNDLQSDIYMKGLTNSIEIL